MNRFATRVLNLSFLLVIGTSSLTVDAKSWKGELQQKLEDTYKPTDVSFWDGRLKTGGSVLVLAQGGSTAILDIKETRIKGVRDGKFSTDSVFNRANTRAFKKGERVLIIKIKIVEDVDNVEDTDAIRVWFATVEGEKRQERGTTHEYRYYGGFDFQFPRKYLATADFADVKKAISSTLVHQSEAQAIDAPATVKLDMTPEQVEETLGKPSKVIDLGKKKVYVYSDLKVTFIDGKVSDVQ